MQPASMAAKTDNSCLLPTWPAGAVRKCLGSVEGLVAERQAFGPCGRHPAIASREARFQPVEAVAHFTSAERQRAGMNDVSCLLPAPNSIKISD